MGLFAAMIEMLMEMQLRLPETLSKLKVVVGNVSWSLGRGWKLKHLWKCKICRPKCCLKLNCCWEQGEFWDVAKNKDVSPETLPKEKRKIHRRKGCWEVKFRLKCKICWKCMNGCCLLALNMPIMSSKLLVPCLCTDINVALVECIRERTYIAPWTRKGERVRFEGGLSFVHVCKLVFTSTFV